MALPDIRLYKKFPQETKRKKNKAKHQREVNYAGGSYTVIRSHGYSPADLANCSAVTMACNMEECNRDRECSEPDLQVEVGFGLPVDDRLVMDAAIACPERSPHSSSSTVGPLTTPGSRGLRLQQNELSRRLFYLCDVRSCSWTVRYSNAKRFGSWCFAKMS